MTTSLLFQSHNNITDGYTHDCNENELRFMWWWDTFVYHLSVTYVAHMRHNECISFIYAMVRVCTRCSIASASAMLQRNMSLIIF